MNWKKRIIRVVIGGSISVLVALIAISEYLNLGYTNAIEAVGATLFSGLLVWLYYRQSNILNNQEELMQQQNRMMMESHRPQLLFDLSGFEPDEDIISFDVKNVGPGTAYDIGFEIELDPRKEGYERQISYAQVVNAEGNEPTSLGILRSSEKKEMSFEIRLPNPDQNAEPESLPVSKALSEFDYSHCTRSTIYIKAVYSDTQGKGRGGSVIEQVAFDIDEPISDVEELWTYGVRYLGEEEEAWIEPE